MKTLQVISILSVALLFCCCKKQDDKSNIGMEIPKLLIRPHIIGPEEEMGHTLDMYNKITLKLKSNPSDIDSRLSLVELFMQEARVSGEHGYYYPAALKIIDGVIKDQPKEALQYRALLDKSSVLMSLHQFAEAKTTGEMALTLNSHSADVYGILVDAHVELGEYAKAVELADKMVSIRPDLRSYSRVSYLREIYGQVPGAIEAMKLAVTAGYPGMEQTEWARLTLGHLYERYGSQDSAMMQYEMAFSARPNYPFAIAAMANIYAARGENKKADSLNAIAKNLIPEVSFYVHQAHWEKERGNNEKVESLTKEVLSMMADDEKAGHKMGLELARVYLNLLNEPDKALDQAMTEYKTRPDNIDVNRMLAEIYYAKGDLAKTQEHLAKALRTGSKDPETKCLEGLMIAKTNNKEEGSKMLKSVFVTYPHLECSFCKEARSLTI